MGNIEVEYRKQHIKVFRTSKTSLRFSKICATFCYPAFLTKKYVMNHNYSSDSSSGGAPGSKQQRTTSNNSCDVRNNNSSSEKVKSENMAAYSRNYNNFFTSFQSSRVGPSMGHFLDGTR